MKKGYHKLDSDPFDQFIEKTTNAPKFMIEYVYYHCNKCDSRWNDVFKVPYQATRSTGSHRVEYDYCDDCKEKE